MSEMSHERRLFYRCTKRKTKGRKEEKSLKKAKEIAIRRRPYLEAIISAILYNNYKKCKILIASHMHSELHKSPILKYLLWTFIHQLYNSQKAGELCNGIMVTNWPFRYKRNDHNSMYSTMFSKGKIKENIRGSRERNIMK